MELRGGGFRWFPLVSADLRWFAESATCKILRGNIALLQMEPSKIGSDRANGNSNANASANASANAISMQMQVQMHMQIQLQTQFQCQSGSKVDPAVA